MSASSRLLKKKQQVNDRNAGMLKAYKFTMAETEVRILPTWRAADHEDPTFFHDFGMTWIKDMDGTILATVGDNKITFGEEDEVRNLVQAALARARTEAQKKHFTEMKASPRVLVNGLVLNDKNVDPTVPQLLDFSEGQFTGPITNLIVKAEQEGDDILSLENGFNLTVTKTGTGFDTRYGFTLARRSTKVDPAVLDKLIDIDAYIRAKFADGEKAKNALKSLMGEPVALIDRSTDMLEDRSSRRTVNTDVTDAEYSILDEANKGVTETPVVKMDATDAEIDALFD